MKARSCAVIEADGVLREVSSQPPLTLRRLWNADRYTCALGLLGSAAGPLDGDDLALRIELRAGARASLTPAGAAIALGRGRCPAVLDTELVLAPGAHLTGSTGAVVVSTGSDLEVGLRVRLSGDAHLCWKDLLVLGRSGEAGGAVRIRWDVERDGWPLLRQVTDLRDAARRVWPGSVGGQRVLASVLRIGPEITARTLALSPRAAVHALAEDVELVTVLASDAVTAAREVDSLLG